jgi:hypothetical protein
MSFVSSVDGLKPVSGLTLNQPRNFDTLPAVGDALVASGEKGRNGECGSIHL